MWKTVGNVLQQVFGFLSIFAVPSILPSLGGVGGGYVYFVHSYYVPVCADTIATADYILPYSASMHKDNFYACQFHPEKSGKVGEKILENFLQLTTDNG